MHLVRIGDVYGKSMTRDINCLIFSKMFYLYNIIYMHTFRYPQDYLSKRGTIKACWRVHKDKMKERWLPYVDYNAFYSRLRRQWRDLYRAIHTPLDYRKLEWYEKFRVKARTTYYRFIYLFKGHGLNRSKRHHHPR